MPPAGDAKASEHLGKTNGIKTLGIHDSRFYSFLLQVPG